MVLPTQLFTIRDQVLQKLGYLRLRDIVDVVVEGYNLIFVVTRTQVRSYRLLPRTDDAEDEVFT